MTTVAAWIDSVPDIPLLERQVLLGDVLGLDRGKIIAHPERQLDSGPIALLDCRVQQLRTGVPLAYVLGHREFWGLRFAVDSRVLVPRPETELLVELGLELAPHCARILDLGTGSGAIAVALAVTRPDLDVTATDLSPGAIQLARHNAAEQGATVEFTISDWFDALSDRWHLVLANPPYVAEGDPHLAELRAEPREALVSGPRGLTDIERIIAAAPNFLHPGGYLLLEHGYDQASEVREALTRRGFRRIESSRDLAGIERVTRGQWNPM